MHVPCTTLCAVADHVVRQLHRQWTCHATWSATAHKLVQDTYTSSFREETSKSLHAHNVPARTQAVSYSVPVREPCVLGSWCRLSRVHCCISPMSSRPCGRCQSHKSLQQLFAVPILSTQALPCRTQATHRKSLLSPPGIELGITSKEMRTWRWLCYQNAHSRSWQGVKQ